MGETGTVSEYQSEGDLVVEWRISNFSTLSGKDGARYHSPRFIFSGEIMYFKIYPNGWSLSDTYGYVDLHICRCWNGRPIRLTASLSLKTAKGVKYHEEHCTRHFDEKSYHHAFDRFIQRSELNMKSSELVPEGVLAVVCTMKSSPSAESESEAASASTECLHCKGTFDVDSLSSHRKKCMLRPTKCPNCLEVVILEKGLNEHECHPERPEAVKNHTENSGTAGVNASTQTEENSAGSLCEVYKKVLWGGGHHDLILKVGDKELRAHRDILRARSRVFESMLDHDMKEKNTGIIDVSDCDPNAMELFLSYVYCKKIEALDHSNMLELYYIADKYEMMELKRECCNFIKKSLSLTNICSVIQLALKHSDSDLLEYATGYLSDNMVDIMQTVEWQSFHKDNFTVGNELLLKSIKKMKNTKT